MRDVLDDLIRWSAGSEPAGLATVVASLGGGAPRPVGAAMAVGPDGTAVGGVSGGCVEAAVYDLAREVAVTGRPQLARFAGSPDDVFAVSRPCGGELLVFVERVDRSCRADLRRLESARRQRVPVEDRDRATLLTEYPWSGSRQRGLRDHQEYAHQRAI